MGGDYADIQVQRTVLDLTVTGTVSSTRCAATARLMQGVSADIARVRLHDMTGRRSVACGVPHSIEGPLTSAALLAPADFGRLAEMPVLTIDATAVTTPNRAEAESRIRAAIAAQNIFVDSLSLGDSELLLYYRNIHYLAETDAIDRIAHSKNDGDVAYGHIKATASNPLIAASVSNNQLGWTVGAGLEYAFLGNWSAKIEYLYVDLGNFNTPFTAPLQNSVGFKENVVRAGLNYKFSGPIFSRF